jgi:hypothetical protein
MANTIEKGACGWVITPDKEHLMGIIQGLTRNEVKEKTERVREKRKSMGWEKEEFGLMNVYSRVTEQLK